MPPDNSQNNAVILIRERIHFLGYPYSSEFAMTVGGQCAKVWRDQLGYLPQKNLATKTNAHGSHGLAHYPPAFAPKIDEVIHKVAARRGLVSGSAIPPPSDFEGVDTVLDLFR
jgi:hypothetical protein